MPTGYTEILTHKDIPFSVFAMRCARAFGATITMRDDDMSVPIPEEFKPNTRYRDEELKKAQRILDTMPELTIAECEAKAADEYNILTNERNNYLKESQTQIKRYRVMLKEVIAWKPPTAEHQCLKDFMIEQLTTSMQHDDMAGYYNDNPIIKLDGEAWRRKQIKEASQEIEYQTKEKTGEIERTKSRNEWIKELRNSLVAHF